MKLALNISAWLIYGFLMAPILVVVGASLTAGNFVVFPPQGISGRWYVAALANRQFFDSLLLSLVEASLVAVLTLLLTVPAVLAIVRGTFRGGGAMLMFFQLPLSIPRIILAASLLALFTAWALRGSLFGLVLGHTLLAFPIAFWILSAAFSGQSEQFERAARVLGASPLRAFMTTSLRLAMPAMVGAATIAFVEAFEDVPIALFLSSPTLVTLPVRIYTFVDQSLTPMVPAASSILVFVVIAAMIIIDRTVGLTQVFGIKPK